jgi:hypothetical protein
MTDDDIRLFNELMSTQPGEQIEGLASRYPDVFEKPRVNEIPDPLNMKGRIADSERKRKEQEEAEFQAKYGQKTLGQMARFEFIPDDITAAIKAIGTLGSGAGAGIKGMVGEAFGLDPEATVQRNIYFPDVLEKAKSGQKLTPDEERELAFYGRYIGKGYEGLEKVSDALEYPIRAYEESKLDALMFMPGTRNISMIDDVIEMGIRGARDVAPIVKPAIQSAGQAARLAIRDDLLPLTQKATQATKEYFETPPVGAISLDALGFSSRLSEGVDKLQDKGTGTQFLAQLSKMKGVPLAEIKVTGLDEYLKNTPKVTKQEVQDYLETNRLQLIEDERIAGAGRIDSEVVQYLPQQFDWLGKEDLAEEFEDKAHLRNHLIRTLDRHFDDLEAEADNTGSFYARDSSTGDLRYIPASKRFEWREAEIDKIDNELGDFPEFNGATNFEGDYQIPGGQNYREILYKLPDDKVEGVFRPPDGHFPNAENTFGSIRATDREIDGTPTLFAEEIQSDWAIAGAKGGYGPQPMPDVDAETLRTTPDIQYRLSPDQKVFLEDLAIENDIAYFSPKSEERTKEIQRLQKKYDDWKATEKIKGSVPDNPFRGNWYKPVINNFLVKAAQEGKGGIGFPTGSIVSSRYGLSQTVDKINVVGRTDAVTGEKSRSVGIDTVDGQRIQFGVDNNGKIDNVRSQDHARLVGKGLDEVIGKNLAKKIMEGGPQTISGEGLKIGGEGKDKLYDEMLPKHLNEIGKRYGVQLEKRTIPFGELGNKESEVYFMPITEEMRNDILSEGLPMFKQGGHVKMAKGGPIKSALEGAGKAAAEVKKAGKLSKLKEDVRQDMGNYGAMRVERAADEIPNLEKLYSERALQEAFKGDNAKVLMTMNPKDFERFAIPLTPRKQSFPGTGPKKESLSTDEYVRYLSGVEGFHSVPFLSIDKEEFGLPLLPFISGHEGRHRNRALAMRGEESGLVRLLPRAELREPFPRRYQDEYIEALKAELGLTGNKVLPEKFNIPSNSVFDKQLQRPEIMLPDIYAKGGAVKSIVSGAQRAAKEGQKMLQGVYRGYTGERLEEPVLSTTPQRKVAEYYATRRAATRGEDPHIEMLMVDPFVGKEYGLALPIDEFNRELLTTRARAIAPSDVVERTQLKKKGGLACLSK